MKNNFKELTKLAKKHKEKINQMYKLLNSSNLNPYFENLIKLSGLKNEKPLFWRF